MSITYVVITTITILQKKLNYRYTLERTEENTRADTIIVAANCYI